MAKLRLILLTVLLLLSLLAIIPAPTYHLWLMAVAVSEYPMLFCGITLLLILVGLRLKWYRELTLSIGVLAIIVFLSPVARAWRLSLSLNDDLNKALGTAGSNKNWHFSFAKLFKGSGEPAIFETYQYSDSLTLDYYHAKSKGARPCVVVIHGGSWSSGDSQQLPQLNGILADSGYNVASINYRLAPRYKAPLAVDDVETAFSYLKSHAKELNIDTSKFVILGRSAGAQIALLYAYTRKTAGLKGVVDFYGPADMVWGYSAPASKWVMDSKAVMERYLGGAYNAMPDKYLASSPIAFVDRQTVPTLIIHGDNDVLVSPEHSFRLDRKLSENSISHFYLKLHWATHGFDYNINGPGGQLSTFAVEQFLRSVIY